MVGRVGSTGGFAAPRRAGRAGGGFALPRPGGAAGTAGTAATGAVAALMLTPDSVPGESAGVAAARHARAALEELRGLQLDLLHGVEDPTRLRRLAALTESAMAPDDPALREAVAGIALRARIELARRRRAVS